MPLIRIAFAVATASVLLGAAIVKKPLPPILAVTTGELPKTPTAAVQIRKGVVEPGGSTIWHTHPSPTFNYVVSGTGTWEFRDQPSQTRTNGQAIEESAGVVTRVVNHGTMPLELVIFQVSKPGDPVLVPAH